MKLKNIFSLTSIRNKNKVLFKKIINFIKLIKIVITFLVVWKCSTYFWKILDVLGRDFELFFIIVSFHLSFFLIFFEYVKYLFVADRVEKETFLDFRNILKELRNCIPAFPQPEYRIEKIFVIILFYLPPIGELLYHLKTSKIIFNYYVCQYFLLTIDSVILCKFVNLLNFTNLLLKNVNNLILEEKKLNFLMKINSDIFLILKNVCDTCDFAFLVRVLIGFLSVSINAYNAYICILDRKACGLKSFYKNFISWFVDALVHFYPVLVIILVNHFMQSEVSYYGNLIIFLSGFESKNA